MVEFRKCFSNFMISITLFNNLEVKNKFLLHDQIEYISNDVNRKNHNINEISKHLCYICLALTLCILMDFLIQIKAK